MLKFTKTLTASVMLALCLLSTVAKAVRIEQVQLSSAQMDRFIPAFVEVIVIQRKMIMGETSERDKKADADIRKIVRSHGLRNLAEYNLIAANIVFLLNFVDDKTKTFVDRRADVQLRIAQVTADSALTSESKKTQLKALNGLLEFYAPIQYPSNVDLVIKYYDKLVATGGF